MSRISYRFGVIWHLILFWYLPFATNFRGIFRVKHPQISELYNSHPKRLFLTPDRVFWAMVREYWFTGMGCSSVTVPLYVAPTWPHASCAVHAGMQTLPWSVRCFYFKSKSCAWLLWICSNNTTIRNPGCRQIVSLIMDICIIVDAISQTSISYGLTLTYCAYRGRRW